MRKLILGVLLSVLLVGFIGFRFFVSVEQDYWNDQRTAKEYALMYSELVETSDAVPFIGEEPYMIVYGTDEVGAEMIIWAGEGTIHSEYADDGISADELELSLLSEEPQAQILRVTPGVWKEEYVWEVFYKKPDEIDAAKLRHHYGYYRFSDGEWLESYRLQLQ